MSVSQETARARNWLKARIEGSHLSGTSKTVTPEETIILKEINRLRNHLIENWDEGSRRLGMNIPNVRCYYCYRAGNHKFLNRVKGRYVNICARHLKEFKDES